MTLQMHISMLGLKKKHKVMQMGKVFYLLKHFWFNFGYARFHEHLLTALILSNISHSKQAIICVLEM